MTIVVTGLATTVVKGTRLRTAQQIELGASGARGDRLFYVIDEGDRMVNGKQVGELTAVLAAYSEPEHELFLTFPDGSSVGGPVVAGRRLRTRMYSRSDEPRLLDGPWAAALSEYVGQPLRLVQTDRGVDRGQRGGASLVSRASIARLAQAAGGAAVDPRRFRMLIEIDGVGAHVEDGWVGHDVRVGDALVHVHGHVGRCLITSRDPDTGQIDLPTLDILRDYRGQLDTTEPLPFGIYGEVREPGLIRLGDPVVPEG